ncbi:putative capsular polysaccharide synthesis family protein [Rhodocaloribacter litoris]|uniref:putative capsular polysaccharide synthesis family protein n=1 Tax=Rhodocaloribacter litoris TaxID=2558931 RepID=UPI00141F98DF|nr:putative capsular polysaccharide synthesis family protein [Rhodocaloribacter litoris]QXD16187.1 putative capsular polysaccharide synthesis family protein [Rhodocaloribacter litoris]
MTRSLRDRIREGTERLCLRYALRDVEHRNPILVYQMGKVGSSTVTRTLASLGLSEPVLHLHTLNPETLRRAVERQRASVRPRLHTHLLVSERLIPRLPFPCRVITLVRDPVARAISFVFEDRWKKVPEAVQGDGSVDAGRVRHKVLELLEGENGIADPTRWFDSELHEMLGIDVFARPFDHERGYQILEQGGVSALVLRLEDLNRVLAPALAAFLDLPEERIHVARANVGEGKAYGASLREVKATLQLPEALLDRIYATRYARHFYAEEIEAFQDRWRRRDET